MKSNTPIKSNAYFLEGDKLYIKRARIALPILVRQAKSHEKIYYSQLASEMGMPNPRNLNYVLGAIGNAIKHIEQAQKIKIPLINCLVVSKSSELPSDGITGFINKKDFEKLPSHEKDLYFAEEFSEIFHYKQWDQVLHFLGLEPLKNDFVKIEKLKNQTKERFGGGESQYHIDFKNYIKNNPSSLGLRPSLVGETEYILPSMDAIDVIFKDKDLFIGIEAKSRISNENDILRGVFQTIKYKALIKAEQIIHDQTPNYRVILALEGLLPNNLQGICNQLGVEVIQNIRS